MSVRVRATTLAHHPLRTTANQLARARPRWFYQRSAAAARRAGIDSPLLVFSFDCDLDRDIEVAAAVHERMQSIGILPAYAVCGELLQRGADIYRAIAATGAEFLNHGYLQHADLDPDTGMPISTVFYDRLTPEEVRADILRGHDAVQAVLGTTPAGFRAPHFGTYQRPEHLAVLHDTIRTLGYRYSSSTLPSWRGPVSKHFEALELPVSGAGSRPLAILDTWSYFIVPDPGTGPDDFGREAILAASNIASAGAGILNIYGDPSHIATSDVFFAAMAEVASILRPSTFRDVVASVR